MAYRVRWTPSATRDVAAIAEYIARDSDRYARKVARKLMASTRVLAQFPRIGRVVSEFNNPDRRELIVYRYRVIYDLHGDDVIVMTVFHGARILPKDFPPPSA